MKLNLKNVSKATWVRIVALFLVLANQIAVSVFELQLIPFSDQQIYEGVSTLATFIVSLVTAWKNNSFTREAQEADEVLKYVKGDVK